MIRCGRQRVGWAMRISDKAFDLIVSEEVTSKASYEAKLRHTEWPQGASGVTVGIGYDLGQTESAKIRDDWGGRVLEAMLSSVLSASGVTGNAADSLATRLKANTDMGCGSRCPPRVRYAALGTRRGEGAVKQG